MNRQFFKKISAHIQELDKIPLFGDAPSLDLSLLEENLAKAFGVEDLGLQIKTQDWGTIQESPNDIICPIQISPIDLPVYWIMTKADQEKFLKHMMFQKTKKETLSSVLQDGFYQFILLEVLSAVQELEPLKQMSLILNEPEPLPNEEGIIIQLELSLGNFSTWGKLFITNSFRNTWAQHFAAFPPQYIASNLSKKLPLELGLNVGSITLPVKDLKKLKPGDFLVPDKLLPYEEGTLFLGKTALFRAQNEEGKIKLIDYAITHEDAMEEETKSEPLSHKLETAETEAKEIKEIPLQVSLELARLKISLDELMKLSPGNLLEIPELAEKKIHLIANGQKIGVAEIVELGETLGLKILEI